MKTFAVACLIASTSAVSLSNSCLGSGVQGVTCVPNAVLFATGMNGDEDLGQDITMKGDKFHYNQHLAQGDDKPWIPTFNKIELEMDYDKLPYCHGTNGPEHINCRPANCSGTNGPKDGPTGTPCIKDTTATIPSYDSNPEQGRPYTTTGDLTPTSTPRPAF